MLFTSYFFFHLIFFDACLISCGFTQFCLILFYHFIIFHLFCLIYFKMYEYCFHISVSPCLVHLMCVFIVSSCLVTWFLVAHFIALFYLMPEKFYLASPCRCFSLENHIKTYQKAIVAEWVKSKTFSQATGDCDMFWTYLYTLHFLCFIHSSVFFVFVFWCLWQFG